MSHEHTAYHGPVDLAAHREKARRSARADHPRSRPDFTCSPIGDGRVSFEERTDRMPLLPLGPVRKGWSAVAIAAWLIGPCGIALGLYLFFRG